MKIGNLNTTGIKLDTRLTLTTTLRELLGIGAAPMSVGAIGTSATAPVNRRTRGPNRAKTVFAAPGVNVAPTGTLQAPKKRRARKAVQAHA